jgi:hypothetical protein
MVAVALAVVAIWREWPRERLLIEVARPIVKMDAEKTSVCWRSTRQLLIVTTEQGASVADNGNGTPKWTAWKGYADLLDTTTHTRSRLTALTDLLKRTSVYSVGQPTSFELSPDGTWLLWDTFAFNYWLLPRAAHMDGTHYRKWDCYRDEDTFFLDSHSLVQMNMNPNVPMMVVRDLLNPKNDREYSKPEQAKAILARYAAEQPVFITVPQPGSDVVGTQTRANIEMYRTQDWLQRIHAEDNGGQGAPTPIQTWTLEFPMGAILQRAKVSPQQRAIFFDRAGSQLSPLLIWLHRMIPKFNPKPTINEALWVSHADGRGLREVGYVPAQPGVSGSPTDGLKDVQWLPDGKQVSFVYHGTLYVVPAVPGK